jgi:NAD(P)H-nitrite reductase large subunit
VVAPFHLDHFIIIGNGIAGITAARHLRQQNADVQITVISAESEHFYSRTALMYIFMGHLRYENTKPYENWFWAKNRIDLKRAYVSRIDTTTREVHCDDGSALTYSALVIAAGSSPARFGWPGQELTGVQGLYGLPDLATMERDTAGVKQAVVVGGGLIGVEMAEMLHSRGIAVTMLVRDATYWRSTLPPEEGALIGQHLRKHHIELCVETELREILPDASGRVRAVVTTNGDEIRAQFVGLAVGVVPNVGFLAGSGIEVNKGVLVNEFFETNVPGVYAIGDCNEFRNPILGSDGAVRKPIEQIWYTGRMHGETLAQTLCGQRTAYRPGVFFNSAKFFGIEYQTYGTVNATLKPDESTFFWQHPYRDECLRINYRTDDQAVVGIHALGLRLRHAICERWILEQRPVEKVLAYLRVADFNPEFSPFPELAPGILGQSRKTWLQRLFA